MQLLCDAFVAAKGTNPAVVFGVFARFSTRLDGVGDCVVRLRLAADLVAGVKKVVVVMEHTAKDEPKLLHRCNLPLTGAGVVDMVITDLGVFTIDKKGGGGMALTELAPGVTVDEIRAKTEADYRVALKNEAAAPA